MKLFKIYIEEKIGKFRTNENMNFIYIFLYGVNHYVILKIAIAKSLISSIYTKRNQNIISFRYTLIFNDRCPVYLI